MNAHSILLDFITRIIIGEDYRLLRFSLFSFLYFPFASSLLGPNIFLSNLFSTHTQPTFLLQCERPYFTPIQKKTGKIRCSVYLNLYIFG